MGQQRQRIEGLNAIGRVAAATRPAPYSLSVSRDERLKMIPVVVLTSSLQERDLVASYKLGVKTYVVKPVDFHEFVNAIKGLGIFWATINEPPPRSVQRR